MASAFQIFTCGIYASFRPQCDLRSCSISDLSPAACTVIWLCCAVADFWEAVELRDQADILLSDRLLRQCRRRFARHACFFGTNARQRCTFGNAVSVIDHDFGDGAAAGWNDRRDTLVRDDCAGDGFNPRITRQGKKDDRNHDAAKDQISDHLPRHRDRNRDIAREPILLLR